ncbi:methyltransferase domain-containing protein [Multifurca ochricompacta]|uniref:Methyltransferase domain-containing protein n=1 Tax=Multifurca ochricompacta TaxID=376703 RepID=A0AAD4QEF2_9AGAM|nr:methyltransferase domain-containing protein [Multifurca ochricompacta]
MLLPRRHPRFSFLLASLLTISLLLLLPRSPLAAFQPSSTPPNRSLRPSAANEGLAAKVRRSERSYQKMLRGRDALISKVGPTPRYVALFPPDKEPWPPYTVWDFFPPAFSCPHELERIGALGDGGKWVCGLSRLQEKENCVVYSVGTPDYASFEAELLARTRHCQLFVFDHTAREYWDSRGTAQRAHFKRYRVAGYDAQATNDSPKTHTLESLMRQNGHTHIDILKIDLEGWEFDTLTAFLIPSMEYSAEKPRVAPVSEMLLELHLWNREFLDLLNWWTVLERAGLRAVAREPNLVYQNYNRLQGAELAEYTFLNVAIPNVFISDDNHTSSSPLSPPARGPPEPAEPPVAPIHEDDEQIR